MGYVTPLLVTRRCVTHPRDWASSSEGELALARAPQNPGRVPEHFETGVGHRRRRQTPVPGEGGDDAPPRRVFSGPPLMSTCQARQSTIMPRVSRRGEAIQETCSSARNLMAIWMFQYGLSQRWKMEDERMSRGCGSRKRLCQSSERVEAGSTALRCVGVLSAGTSAWPWNVPASRK